MKGKLSLDEAWENCIAAWEKIVKKYESRKRTSIRELKFEIVPSEVLRRCWFCEYAAQQHKNKAICCTECPLALIEKGLRCNRGRLNYMNDPKGFLKEIKKLNAKRKKAK